MEKKRSVGINILGIFFLLCTVPGCGVTIIAAMSSGSPDLHIRLPLIIAPIVFLASGIGIVLLKKWARILAIIISSAVSLTMFFVAYQSLAILSSHPEWTASNVSFAISLLLGGLLFISIIYYLTRPTVKEQFRA